VSLGKSLNSRQVELWSIETFVTFLVGLNGFYLHPLIVRVNRFIPELNPLGRSEKDEN
jgi:hypothetical protein